MTKLLIALTLTMAAQAGFAQGFSPWPDRETVIDMPSAAASRMSDAFGSAFRPWS